MGLKVVDIAGPQKLQQLEAGRKARRGRNKIRRLHHHAARTDDMAATRRFYEDLLGMPLTDASQETTQDGSGREIRFLHCSFEMGDGSALAFFQLRPGDGEPADKLPRDGGDHHIALALPDFDELARLKAAFDAHGYPNCAIGHGSFYSLYVRDPNGMLIELSGDAANELERREAKAATAHDELAKWPQGGLFAERKQLPAAAQFPLPTSPREDIMTVVRGIRPDRR